MITVAKSDRSWAIDLKLCTHLILALAAGFAAWVTCRSWDITLLRSTVSTLTTVSATLSGFTLTSMAMMMTIATKDLAIKLRKTGHFSELLKDLYQTGICFAAALLTGVATLFLAELSYSLGPIAFAIFIFGMARFATAGAHLHLVLTNID